MGSASRASAAGRHLSGFGYGGSDREDGTRRRRVTASAGTLPKRGPEHFPLWETFGPFQSACRAPDRGPGRAGPMREPARRSDKDRRDLFRAAAQQMRVHEAV